MDVKREEGVGCVSMKIVRIWAGDSLGVMGSGPVYGSVGVAVAVR